MLDDRPYMRQPSFRKERSATMILIVVNVAVFVLQRVVALSSRTDWVGEYLYLSATGIKHGFIWQFFTFQFLHAGIWHLLGNMIVIYFFGRSLEEALGKREFLKIYFGSGFSGGIVQICFGLLFGGHFAAAVVGASAGAMGLLTAFALLFPDRQLNFLLFFVVPITLRARTLLWFAIGLTVLGFLEPMSQVADAAHAGGILFGAAYVYFVARGAGQVLSWGGFRPSPRRQRELVSAGTPKKSFWVRPKHPEVEDLPAEEFISQEVDPILDKISAHGIQSLTDRERRILEAARAKMGRR